MRGKEPQEVSCGFFFYCGVCGFFGEGVRRQFPIGCGEGNLTLGKVSGDSFRLGVGKRN